MDLLQGIDPLLQLNVVIRELGLLVGSAELFFDILLSPGRKGLEGGTKRETD